MGFYSSLFDSDGAKASKKAAYIQADAINCGTEEIARQFDETQANIRPFVDAGVGAIPDIIQASTLDGLSCSSGYILPNTYPLVRRDSPLSGAIFYVFVDLIARSIREG
ncbi:MAG: hypothetical protein KZQ98_06870 [Candidatus Thiodiazotropha sp. (ex Lucinoma borealis)]|nr:hypothetical protein [Candidatus Thiodiazotropha sp. (ex Lucinoma borealis)]